MENGNKRRDRGGTHVQTLGTMSFTGLELHRKLTPGTFPPFPSSPSYALLPLSPSSRRSTACCQRQNVCNALHGHSEAGKRSGPVNGA